MAKKKKTESDGPKKPIKISEQFITDTLELNYMPYAMSVIVSRAIPEIDGFKPSHRKLLYTMYKMGLLSGSRTKSSNVVGQTMRLNPHGDGAIYETLVRLTEGNSSLIHPFINSKGNFGKQYSRDMAYAAPRYTEVKLAPICQEIFADIDKNTVDFVDNYDSSTTEPILLPTTFPNILINPNQGIAVGMASSFCSFNLSEMCEATINYIKNEDSELLKYIKAPDFPTGGDLIYVKSEMETILKTGRGSFKVRARYVFDPENSCIDVFEIPYTTNIEVIIDKVIQLVKSGKLRDITDIRDETDLNGLKITIDIKKNSDHDLIMQKLFSKTPLQDTFSCNFNLLIDGKPKTLGIKEILSEWVRFRIGSIRRQIDYDIKKKSDKLHLLNGLSKILLDIDKAISIIRNTEIDALVVPNLILGFGIDDIQAEFVAEIKLRNINKEYILNRIKEIEALVNELADLKETRDDDKKIKNIICTQLKNVIKKYGKDRITQIIDEKNIIEMSHDDFIDDYGIRLFLTQENYFKKIPLTSLRTNPEHKLKDDDVIICEFETTNKADILFFSDKQNVYKMKSNDIPDCKASSLGEYLANLLGLNDNEKIIYMTCTIDYSGFMIFAFENGKIAKIPMNSYATKVNRKKLVNAYSSKSQLVRMVKIDADGDFYLTRDLDKATLFNTVLVPVNSTKNSAGIQVYTLKKNSLVSSMYDTECFNTDTPEYYRTVKIPTTGHFIQEVDKAKNNIPMQLFIK